MESRREETFIDDIIQKNHIQKELLSDLEGIKTVFDGGAGCGRFSILLAKCGVKNIRLAGPGAYARTIPNELLVKIMKDPKQRHDFLEFCYKYDSNPFVCGMGKDNLLACGEL